MKWLPTLFAAEAIPSAMITFVALLMFLQLGMGWEMSTLYCALLTLPWMMKSWARRPLQQWGHCVAQVRCTEGASFLTLVALAFAFTASSHRQGWVLLCLFILCLFSAWHELASQMFYEQRLRRVQQRYYRVARMSFTQAAVILTYGVMIVVVGSLEVFYHNYSQAIARSWSTAVYLLAGVYLLLMVWNFWSVNGLTPSPGLTPGPSPKESGVYTFTAENLIPKGDHAPLLGRGVVGGVGVGAEVGVRGGTGVGAEAVSLFLLLLPQALLFHARVLYLFAPQSEGGLGCSLQEIGLAQGTVGVIAFSVGLIIGHRLIRANSSTRQLVNSSTCQLVNSSTCQLSTFHFQLFAVGFSPVVYWLMTQFPPSHLLWLCVATATAQLCFGFGLNVCTPFLRRFFGERLANTVNYLYVPLIALVMLPAMAASGWLVAHLGFELFFAIDALLAIPAWLVGLTYLSHHPLSSSNSHNSYESHTL